MDIEKDKIIKVEDISQLDEFNAICDYFSYLRPRDFFEKRVINNISKIEYKEIPEGFTGEYNYEKKTITINIHTQKHLIKNVTTHELLHAITYRSETSKGFKKLDLKSKKTYRGISIDEAMTEYLTQKITGIKDFKTYPVNIRTYEILKSYIGEDFFVSDYLYGTNKVERVVKEKYGNEGFKIYKKIIQELDGFTIASNHLNYLNKQDEDYERQYNMIKNVLNNVKENLPISLNLFKEICHLKTIEKYTIR